MLSGLGILLGFSAPIILALVLNENPSERFKKIEQTVTYAPTQPKWKEGLKYINNLLNVFFAILRAFLWS